MSKSPGHKYSGSSASGWARQHLGDQIGEVINNNYVNSVLGVNTFKGKPQKDLDKMLLQAVGFKELARVVLLIEAGADLDRLHLGLDQNEVIKLPYIRTDLEPIRSFDMEIRQFHGTPLHLAAWKNDPASTQCLCLSGASPNTRNSYGYSALDFAVLSKSDAVVKLLLDYGATCSTSLSSIIMPDTLTMAIVTQCRIIVDLLLKSGAAASGNIDRVGLPLLCAITGGNELLVRRLLDAGVDVEAHSSMDRSPLVTAVMSGSQSIVQMLLDAGANIEGKDSDDMTPLGFALKNVHGLDIVITLLERRPASAQCSVFERTALIHAMQYYDEASFLKVLLALRNRNALNVIQAITNSNPRIVRGTALHTAADRGWGEAVELLIQYCDQVNQPDHHGRTPLFVAAGRGNFSIARCLLGNRYQAAGIDIADPQLRTPPMTAACSGHDEMVQLLLSRGADVHLVDEHGASALVLADLVHHESIVQRLIEAGADYQKEREAYASNSANAYPSLLCPFQAATATPTVDNFTETHSRGTAASAASPWSIIESSRSAMSCTSWASANFHAPLVDFQKSPGPAAITLLSQSSCAEQRGRDFDLLEERDSPAFVGERDLTTLDGK